MSVNFRTGALPNIVLENIPPIEPLATPTSMRAKNAHNFFSRFFRVTDGVMISHTALLA
jgi:hypothetical protein